MKKCTRCLVSLFLAFCLILSLFTGVLAAPSATLIVTTPSGYDSASEVVYRTVDGYITNWGARGEDCGFLSTYAQSFYTGSYLYSNLSKVSGGTSTSNAPSSSLYSSLQTLMVDRHTTFTKYGSSSGLLCKNLYQYTDCTLGDPTYVSTLYRGLTVVGPWDGGVSYNQEHIWPQSKCLGTASTSDIGDIMQLRAANPSENSSRNNTAYGESAAYYDPGVSVRGDCARTLLYMYVRWGNTVNMWGTDGVIESLDVLLRWIKEDPVDTWEMGHNDAVQSITGTRNVFVDYPEYAYLLFGRSVPADLTTPSNGGDPNGGSGGSTESTVATLVTDASTLKAGDQIIIAALDYDAAMSTTQNTNNRGQTPATKSGSILNYGYDAQILTLESGSSSGTFALRAGSGAYLTAASSSGNYLKTKSNIDANSSWTLGVDANSGAAFITANGTYTRNVMRYNSSSALFSCYSANNTQKDIAIYRLGPGSGGSGGTTSSGSASLVTSTSSLKVGDRIIITALDYQAALGTTQNASNRSQGSVTKNGNSLTYGGDVQVLTLESGNVSGTFALQAGSGKYLYAPSSSANHLKTTDTVADNASWTISINSSTGAASITANGGVTRNVMRYNVGSALFSCYAENNKQADLAIYRIADTGVCNHSYSSRITIYATCTAAGVRTYTCILCGDSYTESIAAKGHSYSGGSCTSCGAADPNASGGTTYYLVGYINGADHGCESDYENMGNYPLVNGTLTTTFHQDSYIFIKTEGNGRWLMAESYCTDTVCTFIEGGYEKMRVPGGVELTFTLTENANGSVTLSYTQGGSIGCAHSYSSKITTAATCTSNGVKTYTCTKCGSSYTETIAALGHNYAGGSCTNCGASDPGVVGTTYYLVGYINGADYGCEGDWQNMGSYKFANGKLTATFNQDSYIFVKTEGNGKWLMADAYCEDTVCTFREGGSEKMKVPGGVKLTFNLTENADGSVSLRYSTGSASVVPTLTLKSPTLEFKDMITVNAMFTAGNTQDVVEMGMITYSSSVSAPNAATAEHMIPGTTYDTNTGRYIAHSQGIHAKYLGDTVYLAVYARLTDGTYAYSKVAPYSPVQYATSQLKNSTDMKLKQLVAAMLNYGAEAQLFFGHNTGSLANASLTAEQKALPESYRADMVSTVPSASAAKQSSFANNSGFSKRYPAISFEGAFCINYFFTPKYQPANGITLYYWNESDYSAVSVLTAANASGSFKLNGSGTGEYSGDILGISAKNLSEAVYVAAVYESGGTTWTSGVLGYSIGSYCSSQASKGTDVSGLAMATAVYGYQAKQYFG